MAVARISRASSEIASEAEAAAVGSLEILGNENGPGLKTGAVSQLG